MLRTGGVSSLLCWVEGQAVCSEGHSAEGLLVPTCLEPQPSTAAEGS